jgi:CBS domain-containing membrane protein
MEWLRRFLPLPNTASGPERVRAGTGALIGLLLTGVFSYLLGGSAGSLLIAPMGASAVLLFCLPASPLAQPWSVIGGNLVSALIGVACARWIADPLFAAPLACCLAIAAMFMLRCLHPPGGAVALTAVLGGPAVHDLGFQFAVLPVGLDSALMVLAALMFNNLTGRRYPHLQHSPLHNVHQTKDPAPTARLGFSPEDLDAVLRRYGQVLDVSRDDLETILLQTEMRAYARRFGVITCGAIMSRDALTLTPTTDLGQAWRLMRHHHVHALPVLDAGRRVTGIVAQSDFLKLLELDEYRTFGERLRHFIVRTRRARADQPEMVGQIMTGAVQTARDTTPIVELVPLMANSGLHHIPVVDADARFVGIVTQSDLVAALYESRLAEAA